MSDMRNYSPEKLFELIGSDSDVEHYLKLYTPRRVICRTIFKWSMSYMVFLYIACILTAFSTYALDELEREYPIITNSISFFNVFCFILLLISIFGRARYEDITKSLQPISGTSRCVEVNRIISDYSEGRTIRDYVLKQGRQLYGFDADLMVDRTRNKEPAFSNDTIDAACKTIYGIERSA